MGKKRRKKPQGILHTHKFLLLPAIALLGVVVTSGFFVRETLAEFALEASAPIAVMLDPNVGVRNYVTDVFVANGAEEMLPIIECESNFKHYDKNGEVLKNRAGSSAVGVMQIMSSVHPDPKALARYNKRHNTDLTVDDFDVTTLEGNVGYGLLLYELRGTRDWECAKYVTRR